jgi:glycosyltransferase involved in cell wall biosynthesis
VKVLLVHNCHRSGSASGDDGVYKKEVEFLERHGHNVIRYNPCNDEFDGKGPLGKLSIALQIPWSLKTVSSIREMVRRERPDVAHVHNFFPLISPSVYHVLESEGVPIVQTLHDFRFLCANAFFMRDGRICKGCEDSWFFKSIRHGCFKGSRLQTIPVAVMMKFHNLSGTFRRKIDAYVCLTESQKAIYLKACYARERIFMKPNFVEDTFEDKGNAKGDYALFIGRLGKEKGIHTLMKAWRALPNIPLRIIGDGPDALQFREIANNYHIDNVEFLGSRLHKECMRILDGARFLVMPSICYETFGLTIVEAFSHAKPVIASNLGAMADIVTQGKTGLLFNPGDAADLAQKVMELWNDPLRCEAMGLAARREYETKYTPEKNCEMLMSIYRAVIERKKGVAL